MTVLSPQAARSYTEAVSAFNDSAFARDRGFREDPTPMQIAEIAAIEALIPRGGELLDIGTGTGIVPDTLRRMGSRVTGIDLGHKDVLRHPLERLMAMGVFRTING